ncbi:MAG: hypothetical protein CSA54_05325 [Gammaproteobacteria bacterium]|nr:MAG: hypothetical protein CSA54_05325 [Gammaproteobacteria bacterium]
MLVRLKKWLRRKGNDSTPTPRAEQHGAIDYNFPQQPCMSGGQSSAQQALIHCASVTLEISTRQ